MADNAKVRQEYTIDGVQYVQYYQLIECIREIEPRLLLSTREAIYIREWLRAKTDKQTIKPHMKIVFCHVAGVECEKYDELLNDAWLIHLLLIADIFQRVDNSDGGEKHRKEVKRKAQKVIRLFSNIKKEIDGEFLWLSEKDEKVLDEMEEIICRLGDVGRKESAKGDVQARRIAKHLIRYFWGNIEYLWHRKRIPVQIIAHLVSIRRGYEIPYERVADWVKVWR